MGAERLLLTHLELLGGPVRLVLRCLVNDVIVGEGALLPFVQ